MGNVLEKVRTMIIKLKPVSSNWIEGLLEWVKNVGFVSTMDMLVQFLSVIGSFDYRNFPVLS